MGERSREHLRFQGLVADLEVSESLEISKPAGEEIKTDRPTKSESTETIQQISIRENREAREALKGWEEQAKHALTAVEKRRWDVTVAAVPGYIQEYQRRLEKFDRLKQELASTPSPGRGRERKSEEMTPRQQMRIEAERAALRRHETLQQDFFAAKEALLTYKKQLLAGESLLATIEQMKQVANILEQNREHAQPPIPLENSVVNFGPVETYIPLAATLGESEKAKFLAVIQRLHNTVMNFLFSKLGTADGRGNVDENMTAFQNLMRLLEDPELVKRLEDDPYHGARVSDIKPPLDYIRTNLAIVTELQAEKERKEKTIWGRLGRIFGI